jgi:hypothetical protein
MPVRCMAKMSRTVRLALATAMETVAPFLSWSYCCLLANDGNCNSKVWSLFSLSCSSLFIYFFNVFYFSFRSFLVLFSFLSLFFICIVFCFVFLFIFYLFFIFFYFFEFSDVFEWFF